MPVTPSNRKALRNSEAKRAHNSQAKAELKRTLKNATVENANHVVSVVDKAAKRNIIHANKAARIKSALAKLFAAGGVKPAAAKKAAKTTAKKATKKTTSKKSAK
jgi:small subunit ribosomal protein S20